MIITVFLALACIVAAGSVLIYIFPDIEIDSLRVNLNKLVLYVFLPALNFKVIYAAQLGAEFWQLPILAFATVFVGLIFGVAIYSFTSLDYRSKGALIIACAFSNVTYFGIAVLQGLFTQQAAEVIRVAILFEITITPLNLIIGSALASVYGKDEKFSLSKSVFDVIKMPLLWTTFIALALNIFKVPVPDFILRATDLLASAVAGLMILSLGMALKYPALLKALRRFWILLPVVIIKLILLPVSAFFGVKWLAVASPYSQAAIIETAMPSQLIALVVADRYKLNTELLAIAIALDTVLAFLTIPAVHYFMLRFI
jgi:predicted permease